MTSPPPDEPGDGTAVPDPASSPPPFFAEELLNAIVTFISAEGWEATRQVVEQNPALLSPQADALLTMLIRMSAAQDDTRTVAVLTMHRDVLRLCQQVGIEQAFERIEQESSGIEDLLAGIARATCLVMTTQPESRADWLEAMRNLHDEALQLGNEPVTALTGAVIRLVEGERPETIHPELDGLYRACWEVIVTTLAGRAAVLRPRQEMLAALTHNTVAALAGTPARREEWCRAMGELQIQAIDLNDKPLAALAGAIVLLMHGLDASIIAPPPEGPYRDCWEAIIAGAHGDP